MLLELASDLQIEGPLSPAEVPASEWVALWHRAPRATVFQSPAWLHAWWAHFGGAHPCLLTFRYMGKLVGIVPIFLWTEERRMLLMGTGITDSLDLLAVPKWERAIADATLQWLDNCRSEWDVFDCQQLPRESPLLEATAPSRWVASVAEQDAAPVLLLPGSPSETPRADELAYLRRRLAKEGSVEIVRATEENFHECMADLVKLHGARWSARSESGVLADERVKEFHFDAAQGLIRLNALRLFLLKVSGRTVAAYYGFHHANRAVYYLGGFDPEWKRFSVGTMIVGHAISEAIRDGAREFNFGRGREPYKYRWGAVDHINYQREFHA